MSSPRPGCDDPLLRHDQHSEWRSPERSPLSGRVHGDDGDRDFYFHEHVDGNRHRTLEGPRDSPHRVSPDQTSRYSRAIDTPEDLRLEAKERRCSATVCSAWWIA